MARRLRNSGGLRGGHLRSKDDADPMASVANIADIMLVFACGLMMALVTVWNIDFTPLSELQDKQLEAIDTPEDMPEDMSDAGNAYVEKGMVYQDPKTGKYYMVTEDKDAMDSDLASQGTSSGDSTSSSSASSSSSSSSSSSGSKSRAASPSGSTSAGGSSSSAAAPDRSAGAD